MIRINYFGTLATDCLLVTDGEVLMKGEAPMLVWEDVHPAAAVPFARTRCGCRDSSPLSGSGQLVGGQTLGTLPYRYIFQFYCSVTVDTQHRISFRCAARRSHISIPYKLITSISIAPPDTLQSCPPHLGLRALVSGGSPWGQCRHFPWFRPSRAEVILFHGIYQKI